MAGKVQVGELTVFALDLDLHRSAGREAGGAADLGHLIFEAVGPSIAVIPLVDVDRRHCMTMPFVGQRVELAVAAIFASAVDELSALEFPVSHRSAPLFRRLASSTAQIICADAVALHFPVQRLPDCR